MTKQQFIDLVAARANLTKRDAGAAVDAFLDVVTSTLQRGDSVTFTGFGKFHTTQRAARMGVNPRTGAPVHIAAATVPKFSAGAQLKNALAVGSIATVGSALPGEPGDVPMRRYCCPRCSYSWSRPSVAYPVPNCPTDGSQLIRC